MGAMYRIYTRGDDGHFVGPPVVAECEDDEQATKLAEQIRDGKAVEIWEGQRPVGKIE